MTAGTAPAGRGAAFWSDLLTRDGHPLATGLPDENLLDWAAQGLLGDMGGARVLDIGGGRGRNTRWFAQHDGSDQIRAVSTRIADWDATPRARLSVSCEC